jgi:hypothetical protein
MESDTLLDMWKQQERLPWAESVLRDELVKRGTPSDALDSAAENRGAAAAIPDGQETFVWYGLVSRMGAGVGAIVASKLFGGLFGGNVGLVAAMLVLSIYVVVLVRRLIAQSKHSSGAGAQLVLAYQWLEAGILSLVVLVGLWSAAWINA